MRLGRPILVAFVATALAAYVLDCSGTTTPAEAMKCCQSMPCSSSGHSQECCETMPQMHAPFVQSPSAHGFSFTPDLIAVLSIFQQALRAGSAVSRLAASCHGPPRVGKRDRKSTRLNSSHVAISYAVFCLKKKKL